MGKIVVRNQPCPSCSSSDAVQYYEDGTAHCFSCSKNFRNIQDMPEVPKRKLSISPEIIEQLPVRALKDRKIAAEVCRFYGVKVSHNENGDIDHHYYPYGEKSFKIRNFPKSFEWLNKGEPELFGRSKFNKGGKRLIICEGEIDTMSVAQASFEKYGKFYPVVGIASSTMTNDILAHREWVRSFNEVILCFDEDDPGQKATKEAVRIIGFDKAKIVKLPENDANDTLREKGSNALMSCIFEATPYVPSGIIKKDALWKALEQYNNTPSVPYPPCLAGINSKAKGMRGGEIALFVSGTGSGKSTIQREIMIDRLHAGDKIGVISLEESPAETARKLAGMEIYRNPAKEEISLEDLREGFDKIFDDNDNVMLLDHQGSINDSSIIDQLEYMCLMGCKYLFIDHITILVSEGVDNLTGNEAIDKTMNNLLRVVKRYPDVWIGLVSHLRKTPNTGKSFEEGVLPSLDAIRGSGSIKQVSFDIFAFSRNMSAENEAERNMMKASVLKCRFTGLTGPVRGMRYVFETGRLEALGDEPADEFTYLGE
jgi:twinkle protein